MIILCSIIFMFIMILVFGEIRFRQLGKVKKCHEGFITKGWENSVDMDIDMLHVEKPMSDLTPTIALSMRGSWRLAQQAVLKQLDFADVKRIEYDKSLR